MNVQISIVNRRIDEQSFRETMFMPMRGDELDRYRKEMNEMLAQRALEGQNSIVREKYLTFSTTATSYEAAIPALARLETDLSGHFKALGCETKTLNARKG